MIIIKISKKGVKMTTTLKEMDKVELVNFERLAYLLKGLSGRT